eukprot:scaffold23412_cov81-Phaeocystis_antarctica.AAC.2
MFGYALLGAFPPSLRGARRHTHLRIKSPPGREPKPLSSHRPCLQPRGGDGENRLFLTTTDTRTKHMSM